MSCSDTPPPRMKSRYRGSLLLGSAAHRVLRLLPVLALVWALSGWALGWW